MGIQERHSRPSRTGAEPAESPEVVAVVGAGASGILTARALLGSSHARSIVLIERDAGWRAGPAYGTPDACHLMNVPAGQLSVDAERPDDFVEWARAHGAATDARDARDAFLPRRLFGEYLRASIDAAVASSSASTLTRITDRVVRVAASSRGAELELESGRTLHVDHVVLALGNPPPRRIGRGEAGVIEDPWAPFALDAIGPHDPLVLVGSGLTAVDIALRLFARGRSAPIEMISRHGLLPRVHASHTPAGPEAQLVAAPTARGLLRSFRTAVADAGGDWQAVMKSIRPRTDELWAALPEPERVRLLRHVSRHWEVHRHRMAPQIAAEVERLIATGRLRVSCGVVTDARDLLDRVEVPYPTQPGSRARRAAWVVNCTGPNYDLRGSSDELVRHLLGSSAARPGPCGLGLDATTDGRLVGRDGVASTRLSTIGPLRRGPAWETTAIPEIRSQAEALAARLDRARRTDAGRAIRTASRTASRAASRPLRSVTPQPGHHVDDRLREMLDQLGDRTDIAFQAARLPAAPGLRAWCRLAVTDDLDAWLIAWGAASAVSAHDHGDSHGAIRVLVGALVESYREPNASGRWKQRSIGAGQSIAVPTNHVHSVANPGTRPALSLHVYSPPLEVMNFVPPARREELSA